MTDSVQGYWVKSKENLAVADDARNAGSYNAAASRYYYALVLAGLALLERERMAYEWVDHPIFIEDVIDLFDKKRYGDRSEMMDALEEARQVRIRADYEPFPVKPNHLTCVFLNCQPILEAIALDLK